MRLPRLLSLVNNIRIVRSHSDIVFPGTFALYGAAMPMAHSLMFDAGMVVSIMRVGV